ncbi:MAG TPA: ABC-type transport auxiliary lipoprotein family protein [Casimicrobiaceae bacterium]
MNIRGIGRGCLALGAVALTTLVGACTALQPPRVENPTLYVLVAQPLHSPKPVRRDVVIEVAQPRAWPGFDTAQIAYVRQPYQLDYFAASRWADTPARMLGPLLARALEQTGSFRAVVQAPTMVPADFRIDTEIVRLQQNFATQPSRVELTLRMQLTDVRRRQVVAAKVFEETENAPSENAAGGVIAANAALQRVLKQVADFSVAESAKR